MPTLSRFSPLVLLFSIPYVLTLAQESREVHKSGQLNKDARVVVDTYKGSVEVATWDKAEIDVRATIVADGDDRRDRDKVRDTEVRIDLSPTSVRIKTDYEGVRRSRNDFFDLFSFGSDDLPLVHYKIFVPQSVKLEIKDYKSSTVVEGLHSSLVIESYKGDIRIAKHEGPLSLDTYKGKAHVEFARLEGRASAKTYKGELEISLPRDKGFELDADIGKGARFRSDFDLGRDRYESRRKGYDIRVAVNGGGPVLRLKCDKGSVRLSER